MGIKLKSSSRFQSEIIKKLEELPILPTNWTSFEDDMIKKYYPTKGVKIAQILGKSKDQIYRRANKLGVRCRN